MTSAQKIKDLNDLIRRTVTPLIDDSYYLFDQPYFSNVGDTLIFQGELDFLQTIPYACNGRYSSDILSIPKLPEKSLVLFNGGGNFGDIWPRAHEFRMRVMAANDKCRFLVFPQTVGYLNRKKIREDADFFSRFDCIICVRDRCSYEVLKNAFVNKILMLPDMAFCINMQKWNSSASREKCMRDLFIRRADCEFKKPEDGSAFADCDVSDWVAMEFRTFWERLRSGLRKRRKYLGFVYDWYMMRWYRPYLIKSGIRQLSKYSSIHTTRLHACILAMLLNKEKIILYDNSYGKNSGFYEAWLEDVDGVVLSN